MFSRGSFQREVAFYAALVRPGELCFDIGAHVGNKVEVLLKAGARVVACEPEVVCFTALRRAYRGNDRVVLLDTGVGAREGEATFYIHEQAATSSFVKSWGHPTERETGERRVALTTLDDLITRFGRPRFCKIDVEGFELEVVKGLAQPIRVISFEYHRTDDERTRRCLERLGQLGDLEVNVTVGETPAFVWPAWLPLQEAQDAFPSRVPRHPKWAHGEVFVRYPALQ